MSYSDFASVAEMRLRYKTARQNLWGPVEPPRFAAKAETLPKEKRDPQTRPEKIVLSRIIEPEVGKLSLDNIITTVAFVTKRHVADIKGLGRSKFIMSSRLMFYYLAREYTDHSLPVIGRFVGGRDHATISSGIDSAKNRILRGEVKFCAQVMECRAILGEQA